MGLLIREMERLVNQLREQRDNLEKENKTLEMEMSIMIENQLVRNNYIKEIEEENERLKEIIESQQRTFTEIKELLKYQIVIK
jgi:chromosome segregation ATPase